MILINSSLTDGTFQPKDWDEDAPAPLVLGTELADNLGVDIGDEVVLISPQSISTGAGMFPKMKKFYFPIIIRSGTV